MKINDLLQLTLNQNMGPVFKRILMESLVCVCEQAADRGINCCDVGGWGTSAFRSDSDLLCLTVSC